MKKYFVFNPLYCVILLSLLILTSKASQNIIKCNCCAKNGFGIMLYPSCQHPICALCVHKLHIKKDFIKCKECERNLSIEFKFYQPRIFPILKETKPTKLELNFLLQYAFPIIAAIGTPPMMNYLLERSSMIVNKVGEEGILFPLWDACVGKNLPVVKFLIEKAAHAVNINQVANDGSTCLFVAAENGFLEIVEFLLANGANTNKIRNDGVSPLWISASKGHVEIVQALINHGAIIEQACKKFLIGTTPFWIAATNGNLMVAELLHEKGANLDAERMDGATPMCGALYRNEYHIVEWLIKKGASVSKTEKYLKNSGRYRFMDILSKILKEIEEKALIKKENL